MGLAAALAEQDFCHLTTTGRLTGLPRTVEIWFAAAPAADTIYLLSGGGDSAAWVRNAMRDPSVRVRIGRTELRGRARAVDSAEEERRARDLVFAKYQPGYGGDLSGWRETALPVAIDLSID